MIRGERFMEVRGITHVYMTRIELPVIRGGKYIIMTGVMEEYYIPDSWRITPQFFPDDGEEPVKITSGMNRWVRRWIHGDDLKERTKRLNKMLAVGRDGQWVRNKFFKNS